MFVYLFCVSLFSVGHVCFATQSAPKQKIPGTKVGIQSLCTNHLKSWKFDRETSQNLHLGQIAVAEWQGTDEDFAAKSLPIAHTSARLDIIRALIELNAEYAKQEASAPTEGYRVVFEQHPKFQAQLFPMGSPRKTVKLSGIPEDNDFYQAHHCPFCSGHAKVFKIYDDHCLAVISHREQILLIPEKHYAHWFEVPLEEQLKLIEHALELRQAYPAAKAFLELHCGSAAFQTVFHTHLRTGIILSLPK